MSDWGWSTTHQPLCPLRRAVWPEQSGPPCRPNLPTTPRISSPRWLKKRPPRPWRRESTSESSLSGWGVTDSFTYLNTETWFKMIMFPSVVTIETFCLWQSFAPPHLYSSCSLLSTAYKLSIFPSGYGCVIVQGCVRGSQIWLPALPRCLLPGCVKAEERTESSY